MLAPAQIPPAPAAHAEPWGSLTLAGETSSFRQSVTFTFMSRGYPGSGVHWWVLHRVTQPNPSIRQEDWVDGRSCPGLDAAMRMLASTPGARFSDPSDDEAERLTRRSADGTDFVLEGRGGLPADPPWRTTPARLRIASNDPGALEPWFTQLTLSTQACWSAAKPPG